MLKVYKKLISYAPEKKNLLYLTVLLSVLSTLLQIIAFFNLYVFLKQIVTGAGEADSLKAGIKVVSYLFAGGFAYFCSLMVSHFFAFRLETNLRKHGIDGLSKSSFSFFDVNASGKVRKLIDDNAAQTHMAVAHLIPDNSGAMVMPILIIILSFIISIRLGSAMILLFLITLFLVKSMMGEQTFMKTYQQSLERMSSETVEYIRGMQIVKIFGIDVRGFKALNDAIKSYSKYAYDYTLSCRRPYVAFQTLFFAIIAFVLPIIIMFTDLQDRPLELVVELMMLFFLSGVMFSYVMKIMYLSMHMFMASDAVSKLEGLYEDMQKDGLDFGDVEDFKSFDIAFENVSFGYGESLIFNNLSFTLEEGKSYALVGPSGGGKSTIAKLISGFYKLNAGQIKIGGIALTDYSRDAIIKNIAFVFQDSKLFKTSIYDNVARAKKDASREEVMKAMELAGCSSIISKFKDGENTVIGTKGVYLSGGEKQRIAIARAILKDAKIVIFDEASAAIDPENEHELQKAFSNLMKNKTVIMIAHRLSSIKNVDCILVVKDGEVVEKGSNDELMREGGLYKHLQDIYGKANDWRVIDEKLF